MAARRNYYNSNADVDQISSETHPTHERWKNIFKNFKFKKKNEEGSIPSGWVPQIQQARIVDLDLYAYSNIKTKMQNCKLLRACFDDASENICNSAF